MFTSTRFTGVQSEIHNSCWLPLSLFEILAWNFWGTISSSGMSSYGINATCEKTTLDKSRMRAKGWTFLFVLLAHSSENHCLRLLNKVTGDWAPATGRNDQFNTAPVYWLSHLLFIPHLGIWDNFHKLSNKLQFQVWLSGKSRLRKSVPGSRQTGTWIVGLYHSFITWKSWP